MDICKNYHHNNPQSVLAFESVQPKISSLKRIILNAFDGGKELICREVEEITGLPHQTASARICELKRDGLLKKTDKVRNRSAVLRRVA
jgi:DNA-binding Lrp family transcriptional regulator